MGPVGVGQQNTYMFCASPRCFWSSAERAERAGSPFSILFVTDQTLREAGASTHRTL